MLRFGKKAVDTSSVPETQPSATLKDFVQSVEGEEVSDDEAIATKPKSKLYVLFLQK